MANEGRPESNTLEQKPQEYRIVLRRGAVNKELPVEDIADFLRNNPEDEPTAEDILWEGSAQDLKSANLWETASLVPTIEPDLYELQLKVAENDYQFVALFGSEEDYEEVIDEVTSEHLTFPGEEPVL